MCFFCQFFAGRIDRVSGGDRRVDFGGRSTSGGKSWKRIDDLFFFPGARISLLTRNFLGCVVLERWFEMIGMISTCYLKMAEWSDF